MGTDLYSFPTAIPKSPIDSVVAAKSLSRSALRRKARLGNRGYESDFGIALTHFLRHYRAREVDGIIKARLNFSVGMIYLASSHTMLKRLTAARFSTTLR